MLTAEARVETARPGRYLAQLGQHLSNKGRHLGNDKGRHLRHRPSGDPGDSGDHARPGLAEQVQVEWSDTSGMVRFPGGQCAVQAGPDALLLRAEAEDEQTLELIENLITSHLDRFSRRDPLTVTWQRTGARAAQPGEPG